jgi:hypothetical protein
MAATLQLSCQSTSCQSRRVRFYTDVSKPLCVTAMAYHYTVGSIERADSDVADFWHGHKEN